MSGITVKASKDKVDSEIGDEDTEKGKNTKPVEKYRIAEKFQLAAMQGE